MANNPSLKKGELQERVDSAIDLLDEAYAPETTREDLAQAVGQALDVLKGEDDDEDDDDSEDDDLDSQSPGVARRIGGRKRLMLRTVPSDTAPLVAHRRASAFAHFAEGSATSKSDTLTDTRRTARPKISYGRAGLVTSAARTHSNARDSAGLPR